MCQALGAPVVGWILASVLASSHGDPTVLVNEQAPAGEATCEPVYELFELSTREALRRFRGDWEPADAVVFSFTGHWPDVLAELVASALEETRVVLVVDPATVAAGELDLWIEKHQLRHDSLEIVETTVNSPWIRDYGPLQTYAADGKSIWLDAGYGMDRPDDDRVPLAMSESLPVTYESLDIGFEGGAIISNGHGLCASTIEYFAMNALDLEDEPLRDYLLGRLGCSSFVLVPALSADQTRHIDMFAQFLTPDIIAIGSVDPRESEDDAKRMDRATQGLFAAARMVGLDPTVVRVPLPALANGEYRTYLNALRVGRSLLVPSYADVPEEVEVAAYTVFSTALREVAILPVPADEMIRLGGALHCIGVAVSLAEYSGNGRPPGSRHRRRL